MSIIITDVSKKFNDQLALHNVSLIIGNGEIVGFIGPNGAGKSTMMRIICGYIPPSSGKVTVNNHDVIEDPLAARKCIGYLPEHNPLYTDMYIKEYLMYTGGIYKLKNLKKKVQEMIEITGLTAEQHKKIGMLSKGYRQRLGLAQALIHEPEVLILDEPTSGLDPNQIIEIRNLISKVGKLKTVLMSTHILQEVEAICNRVIIIKRGSIVADNQTDSLNQLTSSRIQTIVIEFSSEPDKQALSRIKGITDIARLSPVKWIIQGDNSIDLRDALFSFAVNNNLKILGLMQQEKTLEEIFQEITQ